MLFRSIEKVKAFLSTSDDKYRPSYGKVVESHPRQSIIIATVNGERGYLRDITGNRRFWVIKVHQRKQKKKWVFDEAFRAQFWAEAKEIWKSGEKLYLEGDVLDAAEEAQRGATLILSVVLFVVIPLAGGIMTRSVITKKRGVDYFQNGFIPKFGNVTTIGLLLTLVIIFSFQGNVILENPLHIVLIAVPLIIQTFLIFFIAYLASKALKLPHDIAAPAGMIGASNFFELAVAVAISLLDRKSVV